jgi:uncharacterized membrane protein
MSMTVDLWTLGAIGVVGVLIAIALSVLIFIFWISMLIDCLQRKFKKDNDKLVWTLVIIFVGVIGATIYYFLVKKGKN